MRKQAPSLCLSFPDPVVNTDYSTALTSPTNAPANRHETVQKTSPDTERSYFILRENSDAIRSDNTSIAERRTARTETEQAADSRWRFAGSRRAAFVPGADASYQLMASVRREGNRSQPSSEQRRGGFASSCFLSRRWR